ncbi:hypothetical protein PF008_g15219 [Phytophthora fragariae]|uniref:Uncharacterized protein n=1 Tax=Phytophthora fragariae TaxID=53985 RepID=A0A6G0REQ2_9STRA|nr:hypothetical protein PF008_g15219 [Phytophthora fragariae]
MSISGGSSASFMVALWCYHACVSVYCGSQNSETPSGCHSHERQTTPEEPS